MKHSPPLGESVGPGRCLKPATKEEKSRFKLILQYTSLIKMTKEKIVYNRI